MEKISSKETKIKLSKHNRRSMKKNLRSIKRNLQSMKKNLTKKEKRLRRRRRKLKPKIKYGKTDLIKFIKKPSNDTRSKRLNKSKRTSK